MRVLVVEDNRALARVLAQGLSEEGWSVETTHDGADGARRLEAGGFDVVVLDRMLPRRSGLEVLAEIRASGDATPVLMLTARDELGDRVEGLDAGADDYLTKPFEFAELFARLRALTRRARGAASNVVRIGAIEIDTLARTVRCGGRSVQLSAREFGVLECLAINRGRVLTRDQIFAHVYDDGDAATSNVVDVYVGHLRRKLRDGETPAPIHTRRGLGYVMEDAG